MNEKHNKKLTRMIAIAMAATCVASMSVISTLTAFAEPGTSVYSGNQLTHNDVLTQGTIQVTNVGTESGLAVIAYQVLEWDTSGVGEWVKTSMFSDVDIADVTKVTAAEAGNLADVARGKTTNYVKMTSPTSNGTYTATVDPGLYVVLVYGSSNKIYNPAIVSVNLNSDLSGTDEAVDMSTRFNEDGNTAYLKSNTINFMKTIENASTDVYIGTAPTDAHGDVVALNNGGTAVHFKITADIPEYSPEYLVLDENQDVDLPGEGTDDDNDFGEGNGGTGSGAGTGTGTIDTSQATFVLTDVLNKTTDSTKHFNGISNLKVLVNDNGTWKEIAAQDEEDNDYYYISYATASGVNCNQANAEQYCIDFTGYFLKDYGSKSLKVTYDTTLLGTAGINYDENKTTAALSYTVPNASEDGTSVDVTLSDSTYHYTLASGSPVNASNDEVEDYNDGNIVTIPDIAKVDDTTGTIETITHGNSIIKKYSNALPGAAFTMKHKDTNKVYTSISDSNGLLKFVGLDTGNYTLQETSAPSGYALNSNAYDVTVAAQLDAELGIMLQYTIGNVSYINYNGESNLGTTAFETKDTITITGDDDPIAIPNTHLNVLPSTGGAGTIVLTIGAGAAMAGFLGLNIFNRKKRKASVEK